MLSRLGRAARRLHPRTARTLAFMPTPMPPSGVLAVSQPFRPKVPRDERKFALKGVPPLLDAILKRETRHSPHRIISYETEDGFQFNCAAFDDLDAFEAYQTWFANDIVPPNGKLHTAWAERFHETTAPPTSDDWLWGTGQRVLSDTRVGEYQIGHGHRFSRMIFRDEKAREDAEQAAVDPQFEARISHEMAQEGIDYHGRLVLGVSARRKTGGWFTKSRYGTLQDAQKGTWLIKEFLFPEEMKRWFSSYETITGSIASTHLITPRLPDGSAWVREGSQ